MRSKTKAARRRARKRQHRATASPPRPRQAPRFRRGYALRAEDVDAEGRTMALTFSSETPADVWWGMGPEILLHGEGNVRLDRVRDMGAVLFNHNPDRIVGAIRSVEIGADRLGHAVVEFDDDAEGTAALTKARSGSLRGVSVGYDIHAVLEVEQGSRINLSDYGGPDQEVEGPAMVATDWEVIEISLTPVPVDAGVGVGRDKTRSLDGIRIEHARQEDEEMDDRVRDLLEAMGLSADADEEEAWRYLTERAEALRQEEDEEEEKPDDEERQEDEEEEDEEDEEERSRGRARIDSGLYEAAAALGQEKLALRMVAEGARPDAIRAAVLAAAAKDRGRPVGPGDEQDQPDIAAMDDRDFVRALSQPSPSV